MRKVFEIAKLFVNAIEEKAESLQKGISAMMWTLNLPIFVDEEGILFRSSQEEGVVIPAEDGVAIATSITKAQENLDAAQKAAEKKLQLTGWSDTEEKYKEAKKALIDQGIYGVDMDKIPYGKEVAEFRRLATEGDASYDLAQKWYWGVLPTTHDNFYNHKTDMGDTVKGLDEFFATPTNVPTELYWEIMRGLLPNWVVKTLRRDATNRLPIERKLNRSNGVWDSNAMSGRDRETEERTESDKLAFILKSKVSGILDFETILNCDKCPSAIMKELKTAITNDEVKQYAVAYRLMELVNAGWLTDGQLADTCKLNNKEYEGFKKLYTEGVETNNEQGKTRVIDSYVGEWYSLSFLANIDKEDQLVLLKEGMIANLKHPDIYSRMFNAQTDKNSVWNKYFKLANSEKKNAHLKGEQLMLLADSLAPMREKAATNIQSKPYAMRKLAETIKFTLNTTDTEWDSFLSTIRTNALEEVESIANQIVTNRWSVGDANDSITDLSMVKAAYTMFTESSKKAVTILTEE